MKKIVTLLLLTFFLQDISAETIYFKCEGKDYINYHNNQRGYFKKGEYIKSLVINKESKKVSWGGADLKYIPDYDEDGIYEFYTEDYAYDLRFNVVTLLLKETFDSPLTNWHSRVEYLCEKTMPAL
tara:strand:+ start:420 stop:797 length:378 start_codon:yes stop_codon:yes gene_type:complete